MTMVSFLFFSRLRVLFASQLLHFDVVRIQEFIAVRSFSDWLGIAQVLLGFFGIVLVLCAWNKIQTVLPHAIYKGLREGPDNGKAGPLALDLTGNLQVSLATQIFGEDANHRVMRTQVQGRYQKVLTKSECVTDTYCQLFGMVISSAKPGASIKVLDGKDDTGTVILDTMIFKDGLNDGPRVVSLPAVITASNGCYFVIDGELSVTPIVE